MKSKLIGREALLGYLIALIDVLIIGVYYVLG